MTGTAAPVIDVAGLTVAHRDHVVVDGVSLHVRPGEIVGIVGESGSGKSVTVNAIVNLQARALTRRAGTATLTVPGTEPVELLALDERRLGDVRGSAIGIVFQDPSSYLDPLITVRGHLHEALWRLPGGRRARTREATRLLAEVALPGTDEFLGRYPHELSGGQKQRVLIAAAIAGDPALLIADEPTTALDVSVQYAILTLLERLRRTRGLSVLIITHDLGVVAQICDRAYVMRGGRVVEANEVVELFENPRHPYTAQLLRTSFLEEER